MDETCHLASMISILQSKIAGRKFLTDAFKRAIVFGMSVTMDSEHNTMTHTMRMSSTGTGMMGMTTRRRDGRGRAR